MANIVNYTKSSLSEEAEPCETATLNIDSSETVSAAELATEGDVSQRLVAPEIEITSVSNINAGVAGNQRHGARGQVLGLAEESHPHSRDDKHVEYVVIVKFDDRYLKTLPGVVRFLQVVFSVIGLICLMSSGVEDGGYLLLPLSWHLRTFVFISVGGFLMSLLLLSIQVTGLIAMLPINWAFFDFAVYSFLSFMYLFGTSMVASAIDYYQKLDVHVSQWTIEQLIVAVVLGYMCVFLYGSTAVMGYRRWKGSGQFRRYRFKNQNSSRKQRTGSA